MSENDWCVVGTSEETSPVTGVSDISYIQIDSQNSKEQNNMSANDMEDQMEMLRDALNAEEYEPEDETNEQKQMRESIVKLGHEMIETDVQIEITFTPIPPSLQSVLENNIAGEAIRQSGIKLEKTQSTISNNVRESITATNLIINQETPEISKLKQRLSQKQNDIDTLSQRLQSLFEMVSSEKLKHGEMKMKNNEISLKSNRLSKEIHDMSGDFLKQGDLMRNLVGKVVGMKEKYDPIKIAGCEAKEVENQKIISALNKQIIEINETTEELIEKKEKQNKDYEYLIQKKISNHKIEDIRRSMVNGVLEMRGKCLGDKGLNLINEALARNSKHVKQLNLNFNDLTGIGAKVILETVENSNLDMLSFIDFSENKIQDEGISTIIDLITKNKNLKSLNLSWNNISSKGAKKLSSGLLNNKNLETLRLWGNKIENHGVEDLFSILSSTNLKTLDISETNIAEDFKINEKIIAMKKESIATSIIF